MTSTGPDYETIKHRLRLLVALAWADKPAHIQAAMTSDPRGYFTTAPDDEGRIEVSHRAVGHVCTIAVDDLSLGE